MTMKRRPLGFRTFDDIIADLDRLRSGGYRKTGNWDLAQICNHLSIVLRGSLDGFPGPKPRWHMRMAGPVVTWLMLTFRWMPTGVKIPRELEPQAGDEAGEVEELKRLLRRFEGHEGPLHQSPFGGSCSHDTWHKTHLIHCAHHLSFLLPAQAPSGAVPA
jgi:hypothetical protein